MRFAKTLIPFLLAGVAAAACGNSSGNALKNDGAGGAAGAQTMPGCTLQPDCESCVGCMAACLCLTDNPASCELACQGMGGTGNVGQGGIGNTGNVGQGGTGNVGQGGTGNIGMGGVGNVGQGGTGAVPPTSVRECFPEVYGPGQSLIFPNYDQFNPTMGSHCQGTNQQNIDGIERVVFLGDSITFGAIPLPPLTTAADRIYRALLGDMLAARFPGVQIDNCSVNGARMEDFFSGDTQIPNCFPSTPDPRNTLVIMTMGGNDLRRFAERNDTFEQAEPELNNLVQLNREAIRWLKDPANFPNGSSVIFANIYEYTDTSADLGSCAGANLIGLGGTYLSAGPIVQFLHEAFLQTAVETGSDMIFMFEDFCGHGYRRDDPALQCYRGPGQDIWFDLTCIHPNDPGHAHIAEMFMNVVNE